MTVHFPNSSSSSFSLDRFETYSEIAESNGNEFSGSKIVSSAPVTVVSGNLCTRNYVSASPLATYGTYITRQRTVAKYSTQFVAPAIRAPEYSGYDIYIVASMNNTVVNIDGQETVLEQDEIIVQDFAERFDVTLVHCSFPCNVIQFTKGYDDRDGMFAIDVVPTKEFYTEAVFTTSEDHFDHHITVIVDSPIPVYDIFLDGVPFDPYWYAAGDFIYATADVGEDYHVMNSTVSRFAIYTYAHTTWYGGGYGLAVLPVGMY